jgi:hypothetical protein
MLDDSAAPPRQQQPQFLDIPRQEQHKGHHGHGYRDHEQSRQDAAGAPHVEFVKLLARGSPGRALQQQSDQIA